MALAYGGISNSDLIDLQRTTLPLLPVDFEVAQQNQTNEIVNEWFSDPQIEESQGGTSIVKNIQLDNSGQAQHVRLFQQRAINQGDTQSRFTAPWCQMSFYWLIERYEALRNRGRAAYVNLLDSRQTEALMSAANLLQQRGWLSPDSSSDDLNPQGVPFWINKIPPSTATGYNLAIDNPAPYGDFVGRRIIYGQTGTPTYVLTNKDGINPTTTKLFRNYAAIYTTIDAQWVKLARDLFHALNFISPRIVKDLERESPMSKYRIYMNRPTLVQYEDVATKQNDNLGPDADRFHGATSFKRVPVAYANQLDQDNINQNTWGCDPCYFINHSKFKAYIESGNKFYRHEPMSDVLSPNTVVTWTDLSYQYMCSNVREGGGVLHKALAA